MVISEMSLVQHDPARLLQELEAEKIARTEAERERDEAERARRSLQHFLATVAHDLRNPLASILGYAQFGLRRSTQPERLQQALEGVQDEAQRLNELVELLLDAARIGSGEFQVRRMPLNLVSLVGQAVDSARRATPHHEFSLEAPEALEGSWDPRRLAQVLDNLLSNAVKYSPSGSAVRVRVQPQAGEVLVSITDQGIGLHPEDIDRLFHLFSRLETAETIAGTGLGLYISRGIVEAHGGRLWAESAGPGAGSTFSFVLPLEA